MRWIIGTSLRLVSVVLVVAVVVLVLGIASLSRAPVDTLPEFGPPSVQVQTEALGLSASEVEQFITVPLEDEFNGLAWTDHIRSKSLPGLSTVEITFKPGTDVYRARQLVTERVAQGPSMVNVGSPPVMIQPLSSLGRVMMIGLTSKKMELTDLSTIAYWQIRPRLLAVPGVSNVAIWGQRDKELQVLVDPARLNKAGVTLEQVLATTGDAMWTSPLTFVEASSPGADGFVDMPNQRISVQHILPIRNGDDLAQVPIEETGNRTIRLGDVSTVVKANPPLRGDAVLKDGLGFILVVQKLPGANTLEVSRGIEDAMASLKPALGDVQVDTAIFQPASFIESALANLGLAALAAFLLVVAWLGLSARSWRVGLVGGVSIALSLVAAAYVLFLRGTTFNTLTATGLAMALGVVVDGTVLGVVAVRRRLSERDAEDETPLADVVADAAAAALRPLGFGVVIAALVVAPLLLVGGITGSLVSAVVGAYLLAVACAAVVALGVTPVLALLLLPAETQPPPSGFGRRANGRFGETVAAFVANPVWTWLAVLVLAGAGIAAASRLEPASFVPALRDTNMVVQWQATPGTSLAELDRITAKGGDELRALAGVKAVSSQVGQAIKGDQIVDVESAQTWITLDPTANRDATLGEIRGVLDNYAGLSHALLTYPEASLAALAPQMTRPLTVRVYGPDTAVLRTQAQALKRSLASLPGVSDIQVASEVEQPGVQIDASVTAGARVGLSPGAIRRQTSVLLAGIPVGSYYEKQQIFDVAVWSIPTLRNNLSAIQALMLETPGGGRVPLESVAGVTLQPIPHAISHDRASRYVDITANVSRDAAGRVAENTTRLIRTIALPLGYHAEVVSDIESQTITSEFLLAVLAALLGVYLVLQAALGSWGRAALVALTLPVALAGGALAMALFGLPLGAGALAGLTVVLGVAAVNGVMIVGGMQAGDSRSGRPPSAESVSASVARTAYPVAVTGVATALAVLPFAICTGVAGIEILGPMALVVLGGLVTTTAVDLYLLPGLYLRFPPKPALSDEAPATGGGHA